MQDDPRAKTGVAMDAARVLEFWFSERVRPLWYNSNALFDQEIRDRFEHIYKQAIAGALDTWLSDARSALALCILLDQFPLNMYRGLPESFASEQMARDAARAAIHAGLDEQVSREERVFFYLPFMHSENLDDQDDAVWLFERAGLSENLRYARHHRELIRRFGRFPHRNAILDRASTAQEEIYLASPEAFRG